MAASAILKAQKSAVHPQRLPYELVCAAHVYVPHYWISILHWRHHSVDAIAVHLMLCDGRLQIESLAGAQEEGKQRKTK